MTDYEITVYTRGSESTEGTSTKFWIRDDSNPAPLAWPRLLCSYSSGPKSYIKTHVVVIIACPFTNLRGYNLGPKGDYPVDVRFSK